MRHTFSPFLAAFMGVIGLLIVMWVCWLVPTVALPTYFDVPVNSGKTNLTSSDLLFCFIIGAALGASSAMFYNDRCNLGPRLVAVTSSTGTHLFLLFIGRRDFPTATSPETLSEIALFFPMFFWSLALFFFAIIARRRTPVHP